jgi:septal ring factor EnvC (AmiA/AmiB activator)
MENTEKQTEKQSEWKNRELGALWVRSGKNQKYLSGTINVETMPGVTEPVKVVVFTNKGKEKNERAPDYVIYRSEEASQTKSNVEQVAQEAVKEASKVAAQTAKQPSDEDIPEELF